jgi:Ni/Co efflux regulator RcnB
VRQDRRRTEARQNVRQARRWNNANDRRWFESRWNRRARNFDRRAYRRAFVSPRRYHYNGWYAYPRGYYYRRWGVGSIFPSLFWASSNYFINSWWSYGLMSPPWGYEWVRYGPDAVLIDVRTGVILQVRYGVFY